MFTTKQTKTKIKQFPLKHTLVIIDYDYFFLFLHSLLSCVSRITQQRLPVTHLLINPNSVKLS